MKIPQVLFACSALLHLSIAQVIAAPVITEFMASNDSGLQDADGDYPDWIEIHNPDGAAVDLDGYSLSDDADDLTKWEFPAVSIDAGGYLIVFASNKDLTDPVAELHTNFKLSAGGGYLALSGPGGIVSDYGPVYPEQYEDLSYGKVDVGGTERDGFLDSPTPMAANSAGTAAGPVFVDVTDKPDRPVAETDLVIMAETSQVSSPVSSVEMFYRVMFGVESSVTMADDGVAPDAAVGDGIFTASIPGSAFTGGDMIRWRFEATDGLGLETKMPLFRDPVDSHQYVGTVAVNSEVETLLPVVELFLQNPAAAEGTGGTRGAVFYLGELYDNIYMNRHGQSTGAFPKKSFNLDFNKTQRFRWNADEKRVKDIDLLTNWADKSKARHVLSWEIMRESGVHAHFAFTVRVQQNGDFFSTADFVEDADDIYLERAGLNPDGALYKIYDNRLQVADRTISPAVEKKNRRDTEPAGEDLREFVTGLNQSGTENQWDFIYDNVNLPMMVNMAAANCIVRNTDMHRKNWYFYRDTGRTDEWATLPWDLDLAHGRKWNSTNRYFDNTLFSSDVTRVGTAVSLISKMWARPDTREMMRRRIRTLSDKFLNHPDTPYGERYFERRLDELQAQIDPPSITPSDAQLDFEKWGSWLQNGTQVPHTNTGEAVETMAEGIERWKTDYLPGRRSFIYNTSADVPDPQSEGIAYAYTTLIAAGDPVRVKVPSDGSEDGIWMATDFDDSSWDLETSGVGFDTSKYLPLIGANVAYMRQSPQRSTAYIRFEFDVADPAVYEALQLQMKYDDGYIAYLNGVKIHERFAPAAPDWDSIATISNGEAEVDEYEVFDVNGSAGELRAGKNVLAIHGMNGSKSSSDFLVLPQLLAGIPDSSGSVEPPIGIGMIEFNPVSGNQDEEFIELTNSNNIAVDISDWELGGGVEFTFAGGTVIPANSTLYVSPDVTAFRARATGPTGGEQNFVVGGYSGHLSSFGETIELRDAAGALNATRTYVGAPSDAQRFLVITEIMYHPDPDGEAEYIELMNISENVTLDLGGVRFTEGIDFDFTGAGIASLAPGERLLLVANQVAFETAHSAGLPVAGTFGLDTSLSNGGESIKLEDADGGTIKEFTYDDKDPWPTTPDTAGYSLVLISPETNPDPSVPENWRASSAVGGNPGGADGNSFVGDPVADADTDGLSALIEFATGTSDSEPDGDVVSTGSVEIGGVDYATFTYRTDPGAEGVDLSIETSTDLDGWETVEPGVAVIVSTANPDGTETNVLRMLAPMTGDERRYFRMRVTLQ